MFLEKTEIPIVSVNKHSIENVNVINMGVDYDDMAMRIGKNRKNL